ncbi:hypothetical protein ES703_101229 [subsurface metagenome]
MLSPFSVFLSGDKLQRPVFRDTLRPRPLGQLSQAALPDATPGNVNYPQQADAVTRVLDKPEIGNNILNLPPFVETGTRHQLVWHPVTDKCLLEDP